jgi:hypothetical protein
MEIYLTAGFLLLTAIGVFITFRQFKSFILKENKKSIQDAVNEAVKEEKEKQDILRRIALIEQRQNLNDHEVKKELRELNQNIVKLFDKHNEHIDKYHNG